MSRVKNNFENNINRMKKNDIDYYYDNSESHMSDSCKDKKQSNAGIKRTAANSLFPIVKICLN